MSYMQEAKELLKRFKNDAYLYGRDVLGDVGKKAAGEGKKTVFVRDAFPGSESFLETVRRSLKNEGIELAAEIDGAGPNCPREDLFRIAEALKKHSPDVLVSFGGGSTIDAVKSAEVLRTIGGDIEDYFGTGKVTEAVKKSGKSLTAHVAIQTAASSGAHLTKYSNITDVSTGQKKLVVDEAIVPKHPVFDYSVTYKAPKSLTMDGALDGIAHCLEVLYGAEGKESYPHIKEIARCGIGLVVENLPKAISDPENKEARDQLCLATDMGAYSIMVGGTNGGHLTSFSLVDILSHGRACAIMNPYYTVFFAPAIEESLRMVGKIYKDAGFTDADLDSLSGRQLGVAVAEAMFALSKSVGFPVRLSEVKGFNDSYSERALKAAKNPQLSMKLQNMPVPLTAEMIDQYMGPILIGARDGKLDGIKNVG